MIPPAVYLPAVNYLIVRVGSATYAFAAAEIAELTQLPSAPRPPRGAPDWLAGVFEHRGVPVIALSMGRLLGGQHEEGPGKIALLVEDRVGQVALMVDALVGVERVETSMLANLTHRVGVVRRYFLGGDRTVV